MPVDPFDEFVPTRERIAAPFTTHALEYIAGAWSPIPVKGKSHVLSGWTGGTGEVDEAKVRKHLISRAMGYDNLGVRHDGTIAIDVDTRDEKHGDETLEAFRIEHDLPELPPTHSSTARGDDSPCRQYFFRLREYVRLEHKPRVNGKQAEDVEICQYHHRFSVVYPSVHPDIDATYFWYTPGTGGLTWGEKTLTVPRVDELPYLPDAWVAALVKHLDSELDLDADVVEADALISSFRDGEPSPPVRNAIEEAQSQHPGHDETVRAMFKALKYGREGHPGVKQLVAIIYARHKHYLETEHPERARKNEADSILKDISVKAQQSPVENTYRPYTPLITIGGSTVSTGPGVMGGRAEERKEFTPLGVIKQTAQSTTPTADGTDWDAALSSADDPAPGSEFVLPDWVWDQSVELATIKKAALCRMVSPDVVLHSCLATLSSLVHHESYVHTGKGPAPLSHYAAAVGASGTGKTEGMSCAEDLMETWISGQIAQLGTDGYRRVELSTGEGVVEAYMGEKSIFEPKLDEEGEPLVDDETGEAIGKWRKIRTQVRHNALCVADEGRQVLSIASRSGATIMSVICTMWSGASAGFGNAKAENTRQVAKRSYILGMLLGFQPAAMDELFEDTHGGAPQRFFFASATHPAITADWIDWPGELSPKLPPWAPIQMELSDKHKALVRKYTADKNNGTIEIAKIDGHRMQLHCRAAALLALLHSQTTISDEMWDLAEIIVNTSCEFRDFLAGRAEREAAEAARRKEEAQVRTAAASAAVVAQNTRLQDTIDAIVEKLGSAANGELPKRDLRSTLTGWMRRADMFNPAVEQAVARGLITEDDAHNPTTGRKVSMLRLTDGED